MKVHTLLDTNSFYHYDAPPLLLISFFGSHAIIILYISKRNRSIKGVIKILGKFFEEDGPI